MIGLKGPVWEEYTRASALFTEMHRLHRAWMVLQPATPLKRSDMMLMGRLADMEQGGKGPATTSQLARMMRMTPPGISQKVNWLEEEGLVVRRPDKNDRRITYVELTEKGRGQAAEGLRQLLGGMNQALDALGEGKTLQLIALMKELGDEIERVQQHNGPENKNAKGAEEEC